jgi:hypothetical protein
MKPGSRLNLEEKRRILAEPWAVMPVSTRRFDLVPQLLDFSKELVCELGIAARRLDTSVPNGKNSLSIVGGF